MRVIRQQLIEAINEVRFRCDEYVIAQAGSHYLQLMFNYDAIYAEAVSNRYLAGGDRLTARDEVVLHLLGWEEPGVPCDPLCTASHPNFHRVWLADDVSTETIADVVLSTLVAVYMRNEGEPVTVTRGERAHAPSFEAPPGH